MSAVFVTATGTGVGKTWLTAQLVRRCRQRGLAVDAVKPVISGFDPHDWAHSDSGLLLAALERAPDPAALHAMSPWRLGAPLSPDMAAAREGREIPFDELVAFCRRRIDQHGGPLLIEGVGGAMVPLDREHTVLDWIDALGVPAVVVAGSYLGTISHSLTTLAALATRDIDVRALVVSGSEQAPVSLAETVDALSRFSAVPVHGLPRLTASRSDSADEGRLDALLHRLFAGG